jgi:hypothetical protein
MLFAASPFLGGLLSWTALGEPVQRLQLVAGFVMMGGIAILLSARHGHVHAHRPPSSGWTKPPSKALFNAVAPTIREMNSYLLAHIQQRRARPADDLTSELVSAEVDGERLDDQEIVGFVGLLLIAEVRVLVARRSGREDREFARLSRLPARADGDAVPIPRGPRGSWRPRLRRPKRPVAGGPAGRAY